VKISSAGRYTVAILATTLAVGLFLRLRNIDEPPIGYHSMKEVHYLSVAKGYLDFGDFANKRVLYSGMSEGPGYIEGLPQFQFLPMIYYPLWKAFGVNLWMSRLVVILFSLGCILMLFLTARRMTERREIPLIAAFVMAVLPVSVFFGRNIQPDFAALFFGLLAIWLFLGWNEDARPRRLLLFALFAAVTVAIKGTFLVMFAPLLAVYPWRRLKDFEYRRRTLRQLLFIVPGLLLAAAWVLFTKAVQTGESGFFPAGRLFLAEALTVGYWRINLPMVWKYVGENFTYFIFFIFALGLMGCLLDLSSKLSKYVIGSFISAPFYFVFISDFAVRHSYYHIPFVPMICLGVASAVSDGMLIMKRKGGKWERLRFILPLLLILAAYPFLKNRIDWHFDRQMIGADVAGRYIAEHSKPGERVFISFASPSDRRFDAWRTQYYGILWEAGRRGALLPADIKRVRFGEDRRGFRWIVMFRADWLKQDLKLLDYIRDNYSIRQTGYMIPEKTGDEILLYRVLEKGGAFDSEGWDSKDKTLARRYVFSDWAIGLWTQDHVAVDR
jgi:hypothetical protein